MNLDLFEIPKKENLLPYDGIVKDFGKILNTEQSEQYLRYFLANFPWQPDEVHLFGQQFKTDRKIVWFGDNHFDYFYSGTRKIAQPWNAGLFRLKTHIEKLVGCPFNSCLANLYEHGEHGEHGMGWHSDNEEALLSKTNEETIIASLSFGATRKFAFKHVNTQEKVEFFLQAGQLIVMRGDTQKYWKHTILKSKRILEPRINLTFRYFHTIELIK